MESDKKILHFKYVIGILTFIIILVISTVWSDIPGLGDKLAFAMTLSSVVLALLAIYFTFHFSSTSNENIRMLLNANEQINSSSERIESAAKKLKQDFEALPESIIQIDEKLSSLQVQLNNENFEKATENKSEEIEWTINKFRKLFLGLPFLEMKKLYITKKIYTNNKVFNDKVLGNNYIGGIGVANFASSTAIYKALGLINYEYKFEKDEAGNEDMIFTFTNMVPVLDEVNVLYEEVLNIIKDDRDDMYEQMIKDRTKIDNLFLSEV